MVTLDDLRASRPFSAARLAYRPPPFLNPGVAEGFTPVLATGGIGDLVCSMGVIQELVRRVGPVHLWCNYPEVAHFLAKYLFSKDELKIFVGPFEGYDFWIRLNCLARFEFEKNFDGFKTEPMNSVFLTWSAYARSEAWKHVIQFHPGMDYQAGNLAMEKGWKRWELPYHLLGLTPPKEPTRIMVEAPVYAFEPFITVHDGFDLTQGQFTTRATKTWDIGLWARLVAELKREYPGYNIVQLGAKTSRPIDGVDFNLCNKSSITESLKILSRSTLHIDGDSGLVHANAAMLGESVVLFGPTPAKFFGYAENENLESGNCGGCWWLSHSWMSECMLGYPGPICMESISVETVMAAVRRKMNG